MKKIIFVLSLDLCLASCVNPASPADTTDGKAANRPTESDMDDTLHKSPFGDGYYDDRWASIGVDGHPWVESLSDRRETVGRGFMIDCGFMHEDPTYNSKDYEFQFAVSDPTMAEIIREAVRPNGTSHVYLKGLKPGTIRFEFKMVHKETGGVHAVYTDITIENPPAESDIADGLHKCPFTPDGYCDDVWVSVGVGACPWLDEECWNRQEIVGQDFTIDCAVLSEDEDYDPKNYEFQFSVDDPTVVEITGRNVCPDGAVNHVYLKGLKPGTFRFEFKMVHKETGGVHTSHVNMIIIPAE